MTNYNTRPVGAPDPFDSRERTSFPGYSTINDSGADFAATAQSFAHLSKVLGSFADDAAKEEGKQAGATAALASDGAPTLRRDSTLSGKAYDEAVISTYKNRIEAKIRDGLTETFIAHRNDPEAMKTAFDKFFDEKVKPDLIQGAPAFEADIRNFYSQRSRGLVLEAVTKLDAQEKDRSVAALVKNLDGYNVDLRNTAERAAKGEPGAAEELRVLRQRRDQTIRDAQPVLKDTGVEKKLLENRDADAIDDALAAFRKMPDAEKKSLLKEAEGGKAVFDKILGKASPEARDQAIARMRQELSRGETETKRETLAFKSRLDLITGRTGDLYKVPDAEWNDLQREADASGDPARIAAVKSARLAADQGFHLAGVHPAMLDRVIAKFEADAGENGITAAGRERLDQLRKIRDLQRKGLESNAFEYAARLGKIAPRGLDFADGSTFSQRVQEADFIRDQFGVTRYLSTAEAQRFQRVIQKGDEESLSLIATLTDRFGGRASSVMREITKDSPELAHIGRLAIEGDRNAVGYALRGLRARNDPNFKAKDVPRDQLNRAVEREVGDAFVRMPGALTEVTEAARLATEGQLYGRTASPDLSGSEGRAAFSEHFRAMTGERRNANGTRLGGVESVNGAKTLIPRAIANGRFAEAVRSITDDDLAGAGVLPTDEKGRALKAQDLARWYWSATPNGGYVVSKDPPGTPGARTVTDATGKEIVIPWRAIEPKLRERRPDLFDEKPAPGKAQDRLPPQRTYAPLGEGVPSP